MTRKLVLVLALVCLVSLVWASSAQAQVYTRYSSGWGGPYDYVSYGPRVRYYAPTYYYPTYYYPRYYYPTYYYPAYYPTEILTTPWYRMNYGSYYYSYGPYYNYSYSPYYNAYSIGW